MPICNHNTGNLPAFARESLRYTAFDPGIDLGLDLFGVIPRALVDLQSVVTGPGPSQDHHLDHRNTSQHYEIMATILYYPMRKSCIGKTSETQP